MDDLERQLAREGAGRGQVAVAAVLAGLLLIAGAVYGTLGVLAKLPTVGVVQGLAPALRGQAAATVDPRSARLAFFDHHAGALILASVLVTIGILGIIPVLRYLYEATVFRLERALAAKVDSGSGAAAVRGPRLPRAALLLAVGGAALNGICQLAAEIVDVIKAHDYVGHTDRSRHAVDQAINSVPHLVLTSLALAGALALAFAFVMIPLNAMRAGLLHRFMGVLGIVAGALSVIFPPIGEVLEAFWLVALGALLSGRTPNPLPPAWLSGEAEPWPTQQQIRERKAPAAEPVAVAAAPAAPVPRAPRTAAPNASKKRKKRR